LVLRARDGEAEAWTALVERHTPVMWSVTRGFRIGSAARADVVQGAWVALAEHLEDLRQPEAVGGWLASTVFRGCLRETRRGGRTDLWDEVPDVEDAGRPGAAPRPEETVVLQDRDQRLWRAVSRLPERDRRLLSMLTAAPPASYQEISDVLDMPIGSIGPTRARCLRRLREELAAEGIVDRSSLAG
jgi:RNA polymerase sigma factor (sigma-70 family)